MFRLGIEMRHLVSANLPTARITHFRCNRGRCECMRKANYRTIVRDICSARHREATAACRITAGCSGISTARRGLYLISCATWTAIGVANLYYDVRTSIPRKWCGKVDRVPPCGSRIVARVNCCKAWAHIAEDRKAILGCVTHLNGIAIERLCAALGEHIESCRCNRYTRTNTCCNKLTCCINVLAMTTGVGTQEWRASISSRCAGCSDNAL